MNLSPKVCKVLLVVPSLEYNGTSKQLGLLTVGLPRSQFQVRVAVLGESGPQADVLEARAPKSLNWVGSDSSIWGSSGVLGG